MKIAEIEVMHSFQLPKAATVDGVSTLGGTTIQPGRHTIDFDALESWLMERGLVEVLKVDGVPHIWRACCG